MKRFSKIILAMIMALQIALPQAVLADTATNLLYDFTTDPLTSFGTGYSTKAYVQGQSGKAADDTSLKMSIAADQANATYNSVATQAYIDNVVCPNWTEGAYMHYSMEFLPQNKDSYISVAFGIFDSAEGDAAWKNSQNVFLEGSDNSEGSISVMDGGKFTPRYNAWNKVDIYIEKATGKIFLFSNDVYAATGQMNNSFTLPVKRIFNIKINQYAEMSNDVTKASDVYFDNIMLETTDEMPQPYVIMHDFESDWNVVENTLELGEISYVDGVEDKDADDTSVKLSTGGQIKTGNVGPNIFNEFGFLSFHDRTLPYIHFSMEFLQEDANSEIMVELGRSTGDWGVERVITGTSANSITIAGTEVPKKLGEWNKVDIWFDKASTDVVASVNGQIVTGKISAVLSFPYKMKVNQVVKYGEDNTTKASNVYFDNISFEAVDERPTPPNPKIMMDFETDGQVTAQNITTTLVKGQYVKAKNDTSIRMSTDDTISPDDSIYLQNNFGSVPGSDTNEYIHFSTEFLHEDAKSGIQMYIWNVNGNANASILVFQSRTAKPSEGTIFPKASDQADGNAKAVSVNIGMWNKLDLYFKTGTNEVTAFFNGIKYDCNIAAYTDNLDLNTIGDFRLLRLILEDNAGVSSAVQFDNVCFEKVAEVPERQESWAYGEFFDFEDLTSINTSTHNAYLQKRADGNNHMKLPVVQNTQTGVYNYPGAEFGNNQANEHKIVSGAMGQPSWNQSIHSRFDNGDSTYSLIQAFRYNTGVTDLKPGDIGHLTFRYAQVTSDKGNDYFFLRIPEETAVYSDGSTNDALTSVYEERSGIKFYGNNSTKTSNMANDKMVKVDIIYKVYEDSTYIDGYVDGVKVLDNAMLCEGKYLKYVGNLYFMSHTNQDYIIDDVGFGRFTEETMYDPTVGYTITSDDATLQSRIDNVNKIAVLKDYTVEDLSSKVNEVVKIYEEDGTEITSGTMADASVIEVSNGFGGKTYFTMSDCIFEETFDGALKTLKTAFGGSEDKIVPEEERVTEYLKGLGGKDLDEEFLQFGSIDTSTKTGEMFVRGSVGPFAGNTVTFELSARPHRGETAIQLTPNGLSYGTSSQDIVKFMPNNEIRIMRNDIILDEKWIPDQWYKVAAVMTEDNIKVYLNGEKVYDDVYMNSVEAFNSLSFISLTVVAGQCGFDDLRVSYNEYDPAVDLVTSKVDDVFVNNADSIIGFTDEIPDVTADLLKEKVTYDTLTYDEGIVSIRKGETIKYYTLGYKTKEFKRPVIDVVGANAIATAELKPTAKSAVNTQSVTILLAIYDTETGRLEKVVTDSAANSHNATEHLVATIENGVAADKYAVAYMWDGMSTLKPLSSIKALDFADLVSEQ